MQSQPSPKVPPLPPDWIVVNHGDIRGGDKVFNPKVNPTEWVSADMLDIGKSPLTYLCVIRKAS